MKYGELKIECMNVMDEINEPITMEALEAFEADESYKDLFARMPGAINRAMDRIANKKKLPLESSELTESEERGNFLVFDLSTVENYRSIKRISYTNAFEYLPSIEYIIEGKTLMVSRVFAGGTLRIIFYPKAPAVDSKTKNNDELNLPDELARIIPYYVKSDLMNRDEPELAILARNKFESALDEINLDEEDSFGATIQKTYRIE